MPDFDIIMSHEVVEPATKVAAEQDVPAQAFLGLPAESLIPTPKDVERAEGLEFYRGTWHGDGTPWRQAAHQMARAIKDPAKLIRRAKAVAAKWHNPHAYLPPGQTMSDDSNVWKPFQKALEEIGLSGKEIGEIEDYKSDEKEADLTEGLEQWAEEMFDGKVDKDAGDE